MAEMWCEGWVGQGVLRSRRDEGSFSGTLEMRLALARTARLFELFVGLEVLVVCIVFFSLNEIEIEASKPTPLSSHRVNTPRGFTRPVSVFPLALLPCLRVHLCRTFPFCSPSIALTYMRVSCIVLSLASALLCSCLVSRSCPPSLLSSLAPSLPRPLLLFIFLRSRLPYAVTSSVLSFTPSSTSRYFIHKGKVRWGGMVRRRNKKARCATATAGRHNS